MLEVISYSGHRLFPLTLDRCFLNKNIYFQTKNNESATSAARASNFVRNSKKHEVLNFLKMFN